MVLDPLADLAHVEGVPSAVAAATDAVDAVLRDRGLRKITEEQLSQALLAGARANAEQPAIPRDGRSAQSGCRRSWRRSRLSSGSRPRRRSRGHALVARGVVPDSNLGKINSESAMAARMNSLGELLTRPRPHPRSSSGPLRTPRSLWWRPSVRPVA